MTELDSTYAAIDKGFQDHISRLYAVLTQASEHDIASGLAIDRFTAGLKRARKIREDVLVCVRS
jgi:hypothetical protein